MRLGPLFLVALLYIWVFLAAVAWALAAVASHREPRFTGLGLSLLAGAGAIAVALILGGRGGLSLVLSFPLCFLAALTVSILTDLRDSSVS